MNPVLESGAGGMRKSAPEWLEVIRRLGWWSAMNTITQNRVAEWSFLSGKVYDDPFNELELNVLFVDESGTEQLVPAFWAGGNVWRVRFSTPVLGRFSYRTICSDETNQHLHEVTDAFHVTPYLGDSPLYAHGRIRVSESRRYFQHRDGTPFFWLGDTWWMGLTRRLGWPEGFQTLANDRVRKGLNVVQIVAGLCPDMPEFDERSANEAGLPWDQGYTRINPRFWDYADRRIAYLADMGLMPCIVGCWGYFLKFMGVDQVKKHWRNIIARWGAYPVVWCLAGEGSMPYYLSETKEEDTALQRHGWTEMARYVRSLDPFGTLITVHPSSQGRDVVTDPSLLDFDMLQTGHGDRFSLPNTTDTMTAAYCREPVMPVINSEVCYEGIGEASRQEVQRLMFWVSILSGGCGHTYGANGIWQVNSRERLYGPSPYGMSWGNTPWEEAYQLPGSGQLGLCKRLLETLEWWRIEPHPEWIEPHWQKSDRLDSYYAPYAAGIPARLRLVYFPPVWSSPGVVKGIEAGVNYRARLFSPVNGDEIDLGTATPDENGDWEIPCGVGPSWRLLPVLQDWVLVMVAD